MDGFDGIHDQVQDNLLHLDPVAFNNRKLLVKLSSKLNSALPQIDLYNGQNCGDEMVDVDGAFFVRLLFEHRSDACDDVAGAMACGDYVGYQLAHLGNIRPVRRKPAEGCTCPQNHSG